MSDESAGARERRGAAVGQRFRAGGGAVRSGDRKQCGVAVIAQGSSRSRSVVAGGGDGSGQADRQRRHKTQRRRGGRRSVPAAARSGVAARVAARMTSGSAADASAQSSSAGDPSSQRRRRGTAAWRQRGAAAHKRASCSGSNDSAAVKRSVDGAGCRTDRSSTRVRFDEIRRRDGRIQRTRKREKKNERKLEREREDPASSESAGARGGEERLSDSGRAASGGCAVMGRRASDGGSMNGEDKTARAGGAVPRRSGGVAARAAALRTADRPRMRSQQRKPRGIQQPRRVSGWQRGQRCARAGGGGIWHGMRRA
ncbi:hypothetical protein Scep_030125 [Stephania cephalantha]|uniref:Uncharacterized protein n=1 Tax=Stephania cephalantha TaxID=152367 RepID=A0AAP0HE26_9MAGN